LEQRRIDALKRIEVSKQRKTLYDLIASDKITAIFNARANNNAGGDDDDGYCGDDDDWLCHSYLKLYYLFFYLFIYAIDFSINESDELIVLTMYFVLQLIKDPTGA